MRPRSLDEFLRDARVPYTTFTHPEAFTAQDEAALSHVPGRLWAKVVICLADGEFIAAVVPAPSLVDLARLRVLAGARALRLADEHEFRALCPECEAGAMPPFGFNGRFPHRVFVDGSLVGEPEMVFNAGTHTDAIRCTTVTSPISSIRSSAASPVSRRREAALVRRVEGAEYVNWAGGCMQSRPRYPGNPRHCQRQPARLLPHRDTDRRRRRVLSDHAVDRRRRALPAGVRRGQAQRLRPATRSPSKPKASTPRRAARSRTRCAASASSTTPPGRASCTASSSTTTRPASARRWCSRSRRGR